MDRRTRQTFHNAMVNPLGAGNAFPEIMDYIDSLEKRIEKLEAELFKIKKVLENEQNTRIAQSYVNERP